MLWKNYDVHRILRTHPRAACLTRTGLAGPWPLRVRVHVHQHDGNRLHRCEIQDFRPAMQALAVVEEDVRAAPHFRIVVPEILDRFLDDGFRESLPETLPGTVHGGTLTARGRGVYWVLTSVYLSIRRGAKGETVAP